MRESISKFNITRNNSHLLDIFTSASFLELGNIDYQVLERMLNYELINIDDISFFPIQNTGIGKSKVIDEELQKILPFIYFNNINQKNKALQLFITYGLLKYKDSNNREMFTPIIMIPINLYFEKEKIFVQQISRPVENPILISYLNQRKNITVSIPEKLDSMYAIDKFCIGFERHGELKLKLESFLTFAFLKENEIKINHDKFSVSKNYQDYLFDKLYSKNEEPLYYSLPLNRLQRFIVHSAFQGNNLVITGRLGSGKTTALMNVAINAMNQEKRVLYVSNINETLDYIYDFMEMKQMNQYVTNFTNSFASFHQGELIINPKTGSPKDDLENLTNNYKFINDYESAITSRILDHRFIDIINQLIILADQSLNLLEIDDLNNLYKHEYLQVIKSLETIENALQKVNSLKNNVWKDIPIINNIKYPNQVISLIYQIHKAFTLLQGEKEGLEKDFGFKEISNFAYLKTLIHNFKTLNIVDIPSSWKEPTYKIFSQAKEEYRNLKNEIYQIQEMEYYLNHKYENFESINIDEEIKYILGDFFNESDFDKVDNVLHNRMGLVVNINKSLIQIDIFFKSVAKINQMMNWNFEVENATVEELIRFNEILHKSHINFKTVNLATDIKHDFEEIFKKAEALQQQIQKDQEEYKTFTKVFPKAKTEELEQNLEAIEKYQVEGDAIKKSEYRIIANLKKNQPNDFQTLISSIKKYRELRDSINQNQDKFIQITGYKAEKDVLEDIKSIHDYLENLPSGVLKNKVIKFLHRMVDTDTSNNRNIRNNLKSFELLKRSYQDLNELYKDIIKFDFVDSKSEILNKIQDLKEISVYLQKAYASNDRIFLQTKSTNEKYIKVEEYFKLKKAVEKLYEAQKALKNNEKYRYLYQDLYHDHHTNINNISRLLQAFSVYIDCFVSPETMLDSLEEKKHLLISDRLKVCTETSDSLNQTFTLFFKIFKDDVSKYYYDSFQNNINRMNLFLNSKEDLINYLTITDNMQILNEYRLEKLINYIINIKPQNVIKEFKYTYLTMLKNKFLEKYPYLNNFKSLEACLKLATDEEKDLIENIEQKVFRNIKKNSGMRFSVLGIKNLDYIAYVRRTNTVKRLFLTTTQILNNFLNINDYDLVIIDDAHTLSSNEYYLAIEGKQVIISGEFQLQSTIAKNLISRMRSQISVNLNFRYLPTPKNLLVQMKGLKGIIKNTYHENFGIEIVTSKLMEYICCLYKDNTNYVINLFTSSIEKQKSAYENLSNLFIETGFTKEEILYLFRTKINICDLSLGYLYNSDYNILYLEDYYDYDVEHVVTNMIDSLMLCRKKLIIYDYNNYLNEANHFFVNELNRIVSNEDVFNTTNSFGLFNIAIEKFKTNGFNVYNSDNELSMILEKDNKLTGIIIFWDDNNINNETLNEYRDYYLIHQKYDFKIIIIWSMELINSVEKTVERIIMEINNG